MIESRSQRESKFKRLRAWAWANPLVGNEGRQPVLPESGFVYLDQHTLRIALTLNR
jgi:hypothetical protein